MSGILFSDVWARNLCRALNNSAAYASAASTWEGSITLVSLGDEKRAVSLDLYHGRCRSADSHTILQNTDVDFILTADDTAWRDVLSGRTDPILAVVTGKIAVTKGSKLKLIKHAAAARELLDCAQKVSGVAGGLDMAVPEPVRRAADQAHGASDQAHGAADQAGPRTTTGGTARHETFRTLGREGLDFDSFPMQLYGKAKKLGVWDPADISFAQDIEQFSLLSDDEQDVLLRLISMFQAGEEAVTLDLLPLMNVVAAEGRLEEEMYLTTFLFEEAKHTEFFNRFLGLVTPRGTDLSKYETPSYRRLFGEELPAALSALSTDSSTAAQVRAAATYNMIVEGTLAETGYHALYQVLDGCEILPGLREGTSLLQRDESRHIAYGVHLLTRLIAADHSLMGVFMERMNALLPLSTGIISETFDLYDPMPFGLVEADFVDHAMSQFEKRMRRINPD